MINLIDFIGKSVVIIDDDNKQWSGIVESYNPDDDFGDYVGETIDIRVNGSPDDLVCLTKSQIKSIALI